MDRLTVRRGVLLVLGCLLVTQTVASSAAPWSWRPPQTEVQTSAHPHGAVPEVEDTTADVGAVWRRRFQAEAAALASATCDGCSGVATTLQVRYARVLRKVTLDNVANAWAQCTDCRAGAVSVQIVVARKAGQVSANNRALSVNAACTACQVDAAAFQLVVVDPEAKRLTSADLAELKEWIRAQLAVPEASPQGRLAARRPGVKDLQTLVNRALGTTTHLVDVDRR